MDNLHVVFRAHLQITLQPCGRVFRPLAFIAVGQQHHQPGRAQPLGLTCGYELVDHHLGDIGEITKLGLPQHQRHGLGLGIAVFKPQNTGLRQRAVDHLKDFFGLERGQRVIALFGNLIDKFRVALAEGAANTVLPGQPDPETFQQQRAEGQRLGGCPVDVCAGLEGFLLGRQNPGQGFMDG